ncbi:glycosyltransferase WbuB [Trinickia caryophylli]|uniref:Colanic acid biosynthesis glycosyl transferase WcaI n=1 Tax=Trinickia caryophylli TaxID=28094 RepID=A0A1X7CFM3_TRICW|nr:glycosyltransferase WbuB [Trinickia caryophylli]PMS11604.1 colanic acid biosynthesis glycosyltransferase WcaI [Trinickia caryophylli]TRX19838.1 colanic acid biosynthesis glycosyltransferase WcaI [Trinickia caryophylli]WQE12830.1 glycosyltransferase WbuB [Trinickia caryophylli]SME95784.1 colanic acid biosynthesis glycosyl transferase WcaI [Trinickia caryophylli]GLU30550.1 glycosyltransferase WbuB [Trinickia caryophylli]
MKLLVYGLNYAPELTGTGKYTAEMAEGLAARGHEVRVVTAPPYYPEWRVASGWSAWRYRREVRDGVTVWRAPLWVPARPGGLARLVHLASFACTSIAPMAAQWRWRPDVVMGIAPTLLCAPAALALAHACGAASWLHVQDFEVDAAFGLGLIDGAGAARLARGVERALITRFDVVSSISSKMVERLVRLGVDAGKAFNLPNWVDGKAIHPLGRPSAFRRMLSIADDARVVLYAGNMGKKQGLEHLAQAAALLAARGDLCFVFCGEGPTKAALVERCAGLPNCRFIGLQPAEQLNELLNLADVHALPQRADAADLVMPSKLTGMMASGKAIVAMARPGTELYDVVTSRGLVVEPDDAQALASAIAALADDAPKRAELGAAARRFAQATLAPQAVLDRLESRLAACRTTAPAEAGAPDGRLRARRSRTGAGRRVE